MSYTSLKTEMIVEIVSYILISLTPFCEVQKGRGARPPATRLNTLYAVKITIYQQVALLLPQEIAYAAHRTSPLVSRSLP